MGGAIGTGNINPVSEFNILLDPEAASIVFEAGIPLTMVPLEVTHTALFTPEVEQSIKAVCSDSPHAAQFGQCIVELMSFFRATYVEVFRFVHPPVHDPCAVAWLLSPEKFETKSLRVDIELVSPLSAGQTVCDVYGTSGKSTNCTVAIAMDVDWFWTVLTTAIGTAAAKGPL